MLYLVFFLVGLALFLFWQAARQRKSTGLPGGRVIYTDTRGGGPVEKPLYDPESGLTGKPDYLIEKGSEIIPVEVKSSRPPQSPYDSHIYQLAAYCLLVQRTMGKRPSHGILHYTGGADRPRTFAIDYTPELEHALLDLIDEVHNQERRKELARSHEQPARCRRCSYRSHCDQVIKP